MNNAELFMQKFGQAISKDKKAEQGFDEIVGSAMNDASIQKDNEWRNAVSPNNLNKVKAQNKQAIVDGFQMMGQPQG